MNPIQRTDYIDCRVKECKYMTPADMAIDGANHCELEEIIIKFVDGKPVCQCFTVIRMIGDSLQ